MSDVFICIRHFRNRALVLFVFLLFYKQSYALTAVDIAPETPPALKIAVQACAGLYNRQSGGSVYTRSQSNANRWLEALQQVPDKVVSANEFVNACRAAFPKCVRYSYAHQQKLLPNILTVGAVLDAVPVDEEITAECSDVVFDAVKTFASKSTPYLATQYVYENYGQQTTGLAMLNPGYNSADAKLWKPALTQDMDSTMVDFVYSEKLFVLFLVNGCVASSKENTLLKQITTTNPWPRPIGVYGYSDSWKVFGGFFFEAQTRCVDSRNMGAIPTAQAANLSFFSTHHSPPANTKMQQSAPETVEYDPAMTYIAFIVGDGDNVAYILNERRNWFEQRLADCQHPGSECAPITWSISPHLSHLAPDVLEWYYNASRKTGKDYFMLPPSGHLYAYPASLTAPMQDQFVALTEEDAQQLDTYSTIDWEWMTTWKRAESRFLPKYAKQNIIQGIFPVNVPYMLPTFTWPNKKQFYKVLKGPEGGEVVLFRPVEWRGIDNSGNGLIKDFYLSPDKMANMLSGYPKGTVSFVYMTSDGGLSLENSFMAISKLLPPHVRLVSADTAARLALEAARQKSP